MKEEYALIGSGSSLPRVEQLELALQTEAFMPHNTYTLGRNKLASFRDTEGTVVLVEHGPIISELDARIAGVEGTVLGKVSLKGDEASQGYQSMKARIEELGAVPWGPVEATQ